VTCGTGCDDDVLVEHYTIDKLDVFYGTDGRISRDNQDIVSEKVTRLGIWGRAGCPYKRRAIIEINCGISVTNSTAFAHALRKTPQWL